MTCITTHLCGWMAKSSFVTASTLRVSGVKRLNNEFGCLLFASILAVYYFKHILGYNYTHLRNEVYRCIHTAAQ